MATQSSMLTHLKEKKPHGARKKPPTASAQEQASVGPEAQAASQAEPRRVHPLVKAKHPKAVVIEDKTCVLNQANIDKNHNKFYVMQAFEAEGKYYLFAVNGRVGDKMRRAKDPSKPKSRDAAIKEYNETLEDKAIHKGKVERDDIRKFALGVYTLLEMDEDEDHEKNESTYEPLGKLSPAQVERGRQALRKIKHAIGIKSEEELKMLSSEYYTYIPHKFGKRTVPDLIKDKEGVQKEEEFLRNMLQTHVKKESHSGSVEPGASDSSAEPEAAGSRATVKEEVKEEESENGEVEPKEEKEESEEPEKKRKRRG